MAGKFVGLDHLPVFGMFELHDLPKLPPTSIGDPVVAYSDGEGEIFVRGQNNATTNPPITTSCSLARRRFHVNRSLAYLTPIVADSSLFFNFPA